MNVVESRRTRHLVVKLERGDELPTALIRALDGAAARAGWLSGIGTLEAAELVLVDAHKSGYAPARRLETRCDVVSLSGSLARHEGAGHLHLTATLARETDVGLEVVAGHLAWARVFALELSVLVYDDLTLSRALDERTGLATLQATAAAGATAPAASPAPTPAQPTTTTTVAAPFTPDAPPAGPPIPVRPVRPRDEVEHYPEPGDLVNHFHFGDCSVIGSDGERIRLRQERDGRVREVALTMLKIEPPTTDAATGKRHFRLARKN